MLRMMNQAGQSLNAYTNAPAADVEVVKRLVGQIDATFDKQCGAWWLVAQARNHEMRGLQVAQAS
jgi:hypothetical protein